MYVFPPGGLDITIARFSVTTAAVPSASIIGNVALPEEFQLTKWAPRWRGQGNRLQVNRTGLTEPVYSQGGSALL